MDAFCVVSDSGTLHEVSSFYLSVGRPIPAVCIRTSTERQRGKYLSIRDWKRALWLGSKRRHSS